MRITKHLGGTSALALVLATQSAFADVSANDVWNDWRSYIEGVGYALKANQDMSGNVLTVSDLVMSMDLDQDAGTLSIVMDRVTFTENGDGTVSISMPEVTPIRIEADPDGGEPANAQIDYVQSGFAMTASGSPNDVTYDYSADSMNIALASLNVDGKDVSQSDLKVGVAMTGIAGTSTITTDSLRHYVQSATVDKLSYDLDVSNPEDAGRGKFKGALSNLKMNGSGDFPLMIDSTNASAMLAAGMNFTGTFAYQAGNTEFDVKDPVNGDFSGTTSSQDGTLSAAMDQSQLRYEVTAKNTAVNIIADQIPFGLSAKMDESLLKFAMPVSKSDAEQDFQLAVTLGNFTMDDTLWNMFDPANALPRDPATVSFDLTGKAKVLVDFMDPEQAAMIEQPGAAIGELNALSLKNLLISVAGAQLTGKGDFTFDNTQEFNGMPKPTGAVDLQLTGGNGLIDKLVMMGFLPEEQAMGARMMMGLFAVPGDTPDTLNSKIEINEEGHVLANGQRIQ
jgi:hypothetical protein